MAADRQKTIEQRPGPNFKENKHIIGAARAMALSLAADLAAAVMTDAPSPPKPSKIKVETIADGVDHPWGLQFLPDGRLLVGERPGRLRLVPAE